MNKGERLVGASENFYMQGSIDSVMVEPILRREHDSNVALSLFATDNQLKDCGFLHDHFARPLCTSRLGLTLIFARPLRNFLGLTFPHVQNFKVNPDILLTVGLILNLL